MRLCVKGIENNQPIAEKFAFGVLADQAPMQFGSNINPEIKWLDAPHGTESFALILHDPDVPSVADNVNQEGKTVAKDLLRVDLYHWVLVDIPKDIALIGEGEVSNAVVPKGKPPGPVSKGVHGINGYTDFLAADPDMSGVYGGYDGPCPPWNDELVHRYVFTLYALDVASLNLTGEFTGDDARAAMKGHVLAESKLTGTYTLNRKLRK